MKENIFFPLNCLRLGVFEEVFNVSKLKKVKIKLSKISICVFTLLLITLITSRNEKDLGLFVYPIYTLIFLSSALLLILLFIWAIGWFKGITNFTIF